MTDTVTKRPNLFAQFVGSLMAGAGIAGFLMLAHFNDKWLKTAPETPSGDNVYAHVEHGGLSYYTALQSTASHLWIPAWGCLIVGILMSNAAYGEGGMSRRVGWRDAPQVLYQLAGVAIAIAAIYFYGHDILNALATTPFGPANDDLSKVTQG